jgi:phage terminase small subunit
MGGGRVGALKNNRQEQFCQQYIVDYNATQAAIRAGYKEKSAASQASDLLRKPEILERVSQLQEEQTKRLALTADFVVMELVNVYRRCMTQVPVMVWDARKHSYVESGEYTFDSKGALNALEMLGKHLGMWSDKMVTALKEPVKVVIDV